MKNSLIRIFTFTQDHEVLGAGDRSKQGLLRQRFVFLLLLVLGLTACSFDQSNENLDPGIDATALVGAITAENTPSLVDAAQATSTDMASLPADGETSPAATNTDIPPASPTSTNIPPPPTETIAPPPTVPPVPTDLAVAASGIFVHPVPTLYAGDIATVQVLAAVPENVSPGEVQVYLLVNDDRVAMGTLNGRNLGGDAVGLFAWVWDTTDFAGAQQVSIVLDPNDTITVGDENPNNNRADLVITVKEADGLPFGEVNATWITRETEHTIIHVVSGTAAGRDIDLLETAAELAAAQAIAKLQEEPEEKFDIYFIDRVLGQGGYASSALVVSYLDRDYSGGGSHEVLVHEIVHLLDQQFAHHRIPFLVEGVAVWATGGHYKQENLDQRMAALREAGLYVPLGTLIDDFYPTQHEIGYLQGAGFVNYLVDSYGWPAVRVFYADVNPSDGQPLSEAVSESLQRHFNVDLSQLEAEWTAYLDRIPYDRDVLADLLVTVRYYEVMRQYQLQYDPTAHFLQAWLPFPQEVESRAITADLSRHPEGEVNITLEVMLAAANRSLLSGNFNRANALLDSVERVLASDGLFLDPIANDYHEIVQKLSALGFRIQSVEINANQSNVVARDGNSMNLSNLSLVLRNQNWVLMN